MYSVLDAFIEYQCAVKAVFPRDVPNGMFIPKKHNYNANNKRKKGKKK